MASPIARYIRAGSADGEGELCAAEEFWAEWRSKSRPVGWLKRVPQNPGCVAGEFLALASARSVAERGGQGKARQSGLFVGASFWFFRRVVAGSGVRDRGRFPGPLFRGGEPVALAIHLQDMDVMGQPVE